MTSSGLFFTGVEPSEAGCFVILRDVFLDLVDCRPLDDCVTSTRVSSRGFNLCKIYEKNKIYCQVKVNSSRNETDNKSDYSEFRDDLIGMNDFFSPSVSERPHNGLHYETHRAKNCHFGWFHFQNV